jgi:UDP-glucose:glycoprotein glucosyltransferase
MISSIVSGLQVEDSSQLGIFNKGPTSRNKNYKLMDCQYTYVIRNPESIKCLQYSISSFTIGDNVTALHHFAIILDPLSEQAQRYTSLFEVFAGPR